MRFTAVLVSLIYLMTGQHEVHSGIFNAGPYNLKLVRHEYCDDQGTGEATGDLYLIKKSTHKTFLHGHGIVPFDFDDTITQETNFSRLGSRGWGKNAYKLRSKHFCSDFRDNYPTIFEFYFKGWGIEKPSCPIKAGNYTLDMDTDLPRLRRFPMLPYGTYRMSHAMFRGNPPGNYTMDMYTDLPRLTKLAFLPYGSYRISHALSYGNPPVRFVCNVWYVTCSERPR